MAKPIEWTTVQRRVNDLIPTEINPRKIKEEQRAKLIKSIEKFNLAEIPAINKDDSIISGHQRIKALQMIGRGDELIDVRLPNRQLTKNELKEYMLISNTHSGEWDFELFDMHFADINLDILPVDISDLRPQEAVKILEAKEDDYDIPDEIKTDIVLGDLFEIGEHRLLCGDAKSQDDLKKLMNKQKADMVFTDPPYGVAIGAKNRFLNSFQKAGRNLRNIENDNSGTENLHDLLVAAFSNLKQELNDRSSIYVTSPQGGDIGLMMMMMMMSESGLPVRHVLIWVKNAPTFSMGRLDYEYKHEPIFYCWNKTHRFMGGGGSENICLAI